MNANSTRKVTAGRYVTPTGYEIVKVTDPDGAGYGETGWHLIDPTGEWCNTYPTKGDAVEAAGRITEIAARYPL